jgi:hypothetical protein
MEPPHTCLCADIVENQAGPGLHCHRPLRRWRVARLERCRSPPRLASRIAFGQPCSAGKTGRSGPRVNRPCTALAAVPSVGLATTIDLMPVVASAWVAPVQLLRRPAAMPKGLRFALSESPRVLDTVCRASTFTNRRGSDLRVNAQP